MTESYEAKTKSGKIEERTFLDSGKFIIYSYIDEATGKHIKNKLILIGNEKKAYLMIPTGSRELAIEAEFDPGTSLKVGDQIKTIDELLNEIK
jgi:hypothetical protein